MKIKKQRQEWPLFKKAFYMCGTLNDVCSGDKNKN